METAPHDGTRVLLDFGYKYGCSIVVAFWGSYHPNAPGAECWRVDWTRAKLPQADRWHYLPAFD